MTEPAEAVVCSGCGRLPRAAEVTGTGGVPWTWSRGADADPHTALCDSCTREYARSLEAKLDREWW